MRQRAGARRRRRVLPGRRPEVLDRRGRELPPGDLDDRPDHAAGRARQGGPRRAALPARAAQRAPAADHRRADRALGHQGHDGRDPRRRHPLRDAAGDGQAGRGRARAPREGDQGRGGGAGRHAAGGRGRGDQQEPRDAAAALPADADRDRRRAELDGRVPAPDGPRQAAAGGRAGAAPERCERDAAVHAAGGRAGGLRVPARSWTYSNTRASSSSPGTACPCPPAPPRRPSRRPSPPPTRSAIPASSRRRCRSEAAARPAASRSPRTAPRPRPTPRRSSAWTSAA